MENLVEGASAARYRVPILAAHAYRVFGVWGSLRVRGLGD